MDENIHFRKKIRNKTFKFNNEKTNEKNHYIKKNSVIIENPIVNVIKEIEDNNNKNINPNSLVYNSKFFPKSKINDYYGLCQYLKELDIQLYIKNRIKTSNNLNIDEELESEIEVMKKKSEITDFGYDFYNISEIFRIIGIIRKNPEKRTMGDVLQIIKYLTITKLGKYFKEEFEQKEIYEKLITFCGVEMRYKSFKKGETIFKIGEFPDNFYMILFGKVDILKPFSKNIWLTGYQYFCYLMGLKKSNEKYLFYLSIQENMKHFYIKKEEAKDLHYIYLLNIVDQISRHKNVNFEKALDITGITCDELDLDPREISSSKYLLENIKKIKNKLPDISGAIVMKYLFLDDKFLSKELIIFDYSKFLSLEAKEHFGDSAMDSNTTRNATVIAAEDTYVAFINNNLYYRNVVVEKSTIIDRKIQFLNSNFIFGKINQKKFEKKYFGWFICNNYKKGDIIFNEGDIPLNVYFIEQGDVELYSSKNIFELQKIIDYLEKERNNFLKQKLIEENKEKNYIYTYDKINFDCSDLKEQINKKDKKRIFVFKSAEDLGIISFYYGYPYLTSCIVSSANAKIYKIGNNYLSELLMKEKECYLDLVNRIENKISLFHERFFNLNNINLLLADHKKMIEQKKNIGKIEKEEYYYNIDSFNKTNNKQINPGLIFHSIVNEKSIPGQTKNKFNKTFKVNYFKIKEIFNRSLEMNNTNNNDKKNNKNLRASLPIIKSQKINISLGNNKTNDNKLLNKNKIIIQKNEELKNRKKYNSQRNILLKKVCIKKKLSRNSEEKIKNKNKNNLLLLNSLNNKNSIYLNQTNYCIDPILKQNCLIYENLKLNIFKKNQKINSNSKLKRDNVEEYSKKTNCLFNYNNKNRLLSNDNSVLHKSLSMKKISNNYSKDEENINGNNISYNIKHNFINIVNIEDIAYNKKDKYINNYNNPYYAPLVLNKKEKYKIFTDDDYFTKKMKKGKKIKENFNRKNRLNDFGYPSNINKKIKNNSFTNDYLKIKNKRLQFDEDFIKRQIINK